VPGSQQLAIAIPMCHGGRCAQACVRNRALRLSGAAAAQWPAPAAGWDAGAAAAGEPVVGWAAESAAGRLAAGGAAGPWLASGSAEPELLLQGSRPEAWASAALAAPAATPPVSATGPAGPSSAGTDSGGVSLRVAPAAAAAADGGAGGGARGERKPDAGRVPSTPARAPSGGGATAGQPGAGPHAPYGAATLLGCLHRFVRPESLGPGERWTCGRCQAERRAVKQMSLRRLPPVLCLHVKRFEHTVRRARGRALTLWRVPCRLLRADRRALSHQEQVLGGTAGSPAQAQETVLSRVTDCDKSLCTACGGGSRQGTCHSHCTALHNMRELTRREPERRASGAS